MRCAAPLGPLGRNDDAKPFPGKRRKSPPAVGVLQYAIRKLSLVIAREPGIGLLRSELRGLCETQTRCAAAVCRHIAFFHFGFGDCGVPECLS